MIYNIEEVKKSDQTIMEKKKLMKIVIKSLFCQYDALDLERIIGTDKAQEYLASYNQNCTFLL